MSKEALTPEMRSYSQESAKILVAQILEYLKDEINYNGETFAATLAFDFLAAYVGGVTIGVLNSAAGSSSNAKEREKRVFANFARMKELWQDSMAAGVGGAMSAFSGSQVEYYCQLKVVPEAINKTPA